MAGPTHIFVGTVPPGAEPGDDLLVQVYDIGATVAVRSGRTWGPPSPLESRPVE